MIVLGERLCAYSPRDSCLTESKGLCSEYLSLMPGALFASLLHWPPSLPFSLRPLLPSALATPACVFTPPGSGALRPVSAVCVCPSFFSSFWKEGALLSSCAAESRHAARPRDVERFSSLSGLLHVCFGERVYSKSSAHLLSQVVWLFLVVELGRFYVSLVCL